MAENKFPDFEIEKRKIGKNKPVFIIAETGFNHNGNLDIAKKLVYAAKKAGADCIKFQKREVSEIAVESVLNVYNPRFKEFGKTYGQARKNLELSDKDYKKLIRYCNKNKIIFLCTAFDTKSADKLESWGAAAIKIASHSMTNVPLLEHVAKKRLPVILSTGMSTLDEVEEAVEIFQANNTPFLLNHCVSIYPQEPEETNLRIIPFYESHFNLPIGYSGHESGVSISLAAVALGAVAIERHFTLDKNMTGPDHKISLEPPEFKNLVDEIRTVFKALGKPKKRLLLKELATAKKYHSSIVLAVNIKKNSIITRSMLTTKNPGTGIPPRYINEIVGKKSNKYIPKDTLLDLADID